MATPRLDPYSISAARVRERIEELKRERVAMIPHELMRDETRNIFLNGVIALIDFWKNIPGIPVERRIEGMALSVLSTLDGEDMSLPAFRVSPDPEPEDAQWLRAHGMNWYSPEVDISGSLHELLIARLRDERRRECDE